MSATALLSDAMLRLDREGPAARLTIHRPEARNALTIAGWHHLAALVGEAGDAHALLIGAEPGHAFCAGADLSELATLADHPDRRATLRQAMAAATGAIRALACPTIAVIERGCFGAGMALAMACDFRIAGPDAAFAIPPATLGILYPVDDVRRLAALVGEGQAIRLLATGSAVEAVEAIRIGLVEILADDPRAEAEAIADRIAANSAASVAGLKAMARGAPIPPERFDEGFASPEFAAWAAARSARRR